MTAEQEIPKGSYAAGNIVRLPRGARPPIVVYVNGVAQVEGRDYDLRADAIVFRRQLLKEKIGAGRWLAMYLGLFGTYRKHETVDIQYTLSSRVELASDAPVTGNDPADPLGTTG